ncbi:hypothetical protein DH2020_027191 [Rehmannia glutinosa]|uniref:FAF domain-containing protein n=1 Tax=Rehmannia glutinosa TaxID=99300 RepID=A0ABR0VWP9_REHGL
MSTIVCQNLVSSCFESQLTETTTTLKLKLAAAPPQALDFCKKQRITDDQSPADVKTNLEFGNWGFLQTIPKDKSGDYYKESYYSKSSFSRLSPKSLELCTENLGSETGSDIITDDSIFSSSSPPFSPNSDSTEYSMSHKTVEKTNLPKYPHHNSCRETKNFPPPLTSSLQVRRHREGGRLIIEAVEAPFRNSYLQAERSDGRLRLCFLTNSDAAETTTSAAGGGGEEEEAEELEELEEENGDEWGGEMGAEEEIDEPRNHEIESEKEELNDGEINLEMGIEKFQWRSRCKEGGHGNKGLCSNWKPALWVATS